MNPLKDPLWYSMSRDWWKRRVIVPTLQQCLQTLLRALRISELRPHYNGGSKPFHEHYGFHEFTTLGAQSCAHITIAVLQSAELHPRYKHKTRSKCNLSEGGNECNLSEGKSKCQWQCQMKAEANVDNSAKWRQKQQIIQCQQDEINANMEASRKQCYEAKAEVIIGLKHFRSQQLTSLLLMMKPSGGGSDN